MRLNLLTALCVLLTHFVSAQEFTSGNKVTLPDSLVSDKIEWVDLDNDGLLDLLISSHTNQQHYFLIVKTDTAVAPVVMAVVPILEHDAYQLKDYNRDNLIDIIVTGKETSDGTVVYLNKGDFLFDVNDIAAFAFKKSTFGDLDNDGKEEWIVNVATDSGSYVKILKDINGAWIDRGPVLKIELTSLEVIASDQNGFHDLFISGRVDADSLFTGVLFGDGKLNFTHSYMLGYQGIGSIIDFNDDGLDDILFFGEDLLHQKALRRLKISGSGKFDVDTLDHHFEAVNMFAADFNSNGVPDVAYYGVRPEGDTINVIQFDDATPFFLDHKNVIAQSFGDVEHDGDLDVAQLVLEQDTLRIQHYSNNAQHNTGPSLGIPMAGFSFLGRVFLYWEKGDDDHTPKSSITYDLAFKNNSGDLLAADFDLINGRRLKATAGNNGTQNFRLLKNVNHDGFFWTVQPIDNALHTNTDTGSGGSGTGTCVPCTTEFAIEFVSACSKESVTLETEHDVMWFSFRDGFLGNGKESKVDMTVPDTVFFVDPKAVSCLSLKVFILKLDETPHAVLEDEVLDCKGKVQYLSVESGWDVSWFSLIGGDLGKGASISYLMNAVDTVTATMKNVEGCILQRKFPINIRVPSIDATPEQVKILKGDYISLHVSGGETYTWTPGDHLEGATTDTPVASPLVTTTYVVTGVDFYGCASSDSVVVIVEHTGFIANLFTPNGDNVNDLLKIFGVSSASDFSFKVYDREGNVLFQTNDIAVAARGWDGKHKGVNQPGGVYYWKVSGKIGTGAKLLLNGKDTGSVVLIR